MHEKTCIKVLTFALILSLIPLRFSISDTNGSTSNQLSNATVHFINVGWGDAIFIDTVGKDVLIDGARAASGGIVLDYLTRLNISRVDLMIATHPHEDHVDGLVNVLNSTIEVNQVLVNNETYPLSFWRLARNHNLTVAFRGQTFILADTVNLTVLNPVQPLTFPPYDPWRHYNNIVVKLQAGKRSFLFTGDANALVEQNMIGAGLNLQSDVLKVGVHGSVEEATTQAFLGSVRPKYAVISCNYTNGYWIKAPDRNITWRLLANNITTYSTHIMGTIVASTDGDFISFSDNTKYPCVTELRGHTKAVYSVAWSPTGDILASGSKDGNVRLWNTTTWINSLTINAHTSGVWSVAFSPDGTKLATSGVDGKIRLWDPKTGNATMTLNVSSPYVTVYSVSWSPDGSMLAAGVSNGQVLVFDVQAKTILSTLIGHTQAVIATTWSQDGSRLASGSIDQTIRIWNVETGLSISILRANTTARNDINGLAWSSDDALLAAAGQDGNVRLWNPETESEIDVLGKSYGWARGISWSSDNLILATTGEDCLVHLWNFYGGENVETLAGHLSPVWSISWSPERNLLASGSGEYEVDAGDTRILVWRPPAALVVPDEYSTIQMAINQANVGDTIFVRNGTYYEHVVVNKSLSIVGENKENTLIDGNKTGPVILVVANGVNLTGFTIRAGQNSHPICNVFLKNVSKCSIYGNILIYSFYGVSINESNGNSVYENFATNVSIGICGVNSDWNSVFRNKFVANSFAGINFHLCSFSNVTGNLISGNSIGMRLLDGANNNTIHHNNFVNNTVQVYVQNSFNNIWDDGYPSGGNYWSDYTDVDLYSGPYQTDTGSDNIWDHPYVIGVNNQDRYALANPFTLGDFNHDGAVDGSDFYILLQAWGTSPPSDPRADVDDDGLVDGGDFYILLQNWG